MDGFTTKLQLRIDWSEIDAFGHLNNLAIMKYVQAARVNYSEPLGLMDSQATTKVGPILAAINCQFRKPLFFPGTVTVYSKIEAIKTTSFIMKHVVCDEQGEIAAEAEDVIVYYDFANDTKLPVPADLRRKIEAHENRKF